MPDLSDTLRKCRIGTAKNFTLLLLLYHTQAKPADVTPEPKPEPAPEPEPEPEPDPEPGEAPDTGDDTQPDPAPGGEDVSGE